MRRFVVGDIHGAYEALMLVLSAADFDRDNDLLIGLGDYVDSWPDTPEVIDFLMGLPNFLGVIGNHDAWAAEWMQGGRIDRNWYNQGGEMTVESYRLEDTTFDKVKMNLHGKFLDSLPCYVLLDGKLFVHGGIDPTKDLDLADRYSVTWDRGLFKAAVFRLLYPSQFSKPVPLGPFKEVYLGHTSTSQIDSSLKPVMMDNIWMLDQGAGWEGKLTLMDIDTKEYWQSDLVTKLYPGITHR